MTNGRKLTLKSRINLARLEHAVTRLESAVMLALMIIAIPAMHILSANELVPDWAWIAVLVFGLSAEGILIFASLSDPVSGIAQVGLMLKRHFGILAIGDESIRQLVDRAIDYRARMEDVIGGRRQAARGAMAESLAAVDSWLAGIGRLAARLDRFHGEASYQAAEKFQLRERIDNLERRAREASDPKVQQQLRETIAGSKHQLRLIGELENVVERGGLRLEHAVVALGTIYTQVTIFAARGMDEGDATRLSSEISEEIEQVDAVLAAMDRVLDSPVAFKDSDSPPEPDAITEIRGG